MAQPDDDGAYLRCIVAMNLAQIERQYKYNTIEANPKNHIDDAA